VSDAVSSANRSQTSRLLKHFDRGQGDVVASQALGHGQREIVPEHGQVDITIHGLAGRVCGTALHGSSLLSGSCFHDLIVLLQPDRGKPRHESRRRAEPALPLSHYLCPFRHLSGIINRIRVHPRSSAVPRGVMREASLVERGMTISPPPFVAFVHFVVSRQWPVGNLRKSAKSADEIVARCSSLGTRISQDNPSASVFIRVHPRSSAVCVRRSDGFLLPQD